MKFSAFAFSQPTAPPFQIDYLIVGGGGAAQAYDSTRTCGGGGAGGFLSGSITYAVGLTSPIIQVGFGGPRTPGATVANGEGADGGNSIAFGLTAYGGGGGGNSNGGSGTFVSAGRPGGSGGGGGASRNSVSTVIQTAAGGTGVAGQGFDGGQSWSNGASNLWRAGSGGGAGGPATSGSLGNSDPGPEKAWVDGNMYAGGGGAYPASIQYTTKGSGGRVQFNTTFGTEGYPGVVKFRYSGSVAVFAEGDVAISGGYVYHTFNAPSASTYPGTPGYFNLTFIG